MEKQLLIISKNKAFEDIFPFRKIGFNKIILTDNISYMIEILNNNMCELIFIDMEIIFYNTLSLINTIVITNPRIPIIIVSKRINPFFIVKIILAGAIDFIEYPCSLQFFYLRVADILSKHCKKIEISSTYNENGLEKLIGESQKILEVKTLLIKFSKTPYPILILGESGTGKNVVSQIIHNNSEQKKFLFIL